MEFADQEITKRYFKAIIIRLGTAKGEARCCFRCFKETELLSVRAVAGEGGEEKGSTAGVRADTGVSHKCVSAPR
jgi:hypothetical protein